MPKFTKGKLLLACLACFTLGSFWGSLGPNKLAGDQKVSRPAVLPFPMEARLGANLYLQTSAEYRACCLQTYHCAELRLKDLLERTHPKPLKPAVVMDLDETVFDNSAFETFLYRSKAEYSDALWARYEEKYPQDVTLIPGARQFIHKAEALGVEVVFISNRTEPFRKSTEAALGRLGVGGKHLSERLYLRPKNGTSDKSARREAVAARYNVLLYFGDNLRDFSEAFVAGKLPPNPTPDDCLKEIRRRARQVDEAACHWGVDWFVLPNPVYGEWEKLLGTDPKAILHPTSMPVPKLGNGPPAAHPG